ncbi:MAG: hypothetical protein U0X20_23610 [Caldilineaceae bacterium]
MTMQVGEILERVDDLDDKRARYREAARQWQEMWLLKAFDDDAETSIKKYKREQVTLPIPYNIVHLGRRLIASEPKIEIPSGTSQQDDDESAQKRERWLTAYWQRADREQRRMIIADAAWQTMVRGRFVFEVKWVREQLPQRLRDQRLPILVRTLDPLSVGIKAGPLYTEYAYHRYEDERSLVQQRYPTVQLSQRAGVYRAAPTDLIQVVDYWWTDVTDGAIWNAVLVDDQFAVPPQKTKYPDIPIVEGYGDSAPIVGEEFKGLSILYPLQELWPYMCRLASQIGTGLLYYFWPAILIENELGAEIPNINVAPGTTTVLPPGTRVNPLKVDVNIPLAQSMLGLVDQHAQQSTFPGVMYGQQPGELQAGYGVSILADQARGRINQFRTGLESGLEHVDALILGLVEAYAGRKGVSLWGKAQGAGNLYHETLTPKDIAGLYENLVSLAPQLSTDEIQKQTLGMRMVEAKIMSKRTFRDKHMTVPMPPDEELRIQVEQALESDMLSPKTQLNALRAYFPDSYSNIIAGTPFQQLEMQESQGAQPPPQPGAPMGGMPPQGMPMLPPGAGPQIPQGMPPQMMMPPQGGPPPGPMPLQAPGMIQGIPPQMQGGLTPEAMGIPPELDGLGVYQQMLGQQMSPEEEEQRMMGLPPGMQG